VVEDGYINYMMIKKTFLHIFAPLSVLEQLKYPRIWTLFFILIIGILIPSSSLKAEEATADIYPYYKVDGPVLFDSTSAVTILWTSTQVSSCIVTRNTDNNRWTGTSGSLYYLGEVLGSITPRVTYTLTCTTLTGDTIRDSATAIPVKQSFPVLDVKAFQSGVEKEVLSWNRVPDAIGYSVYRNDYQDNTDAYSTDRNWELNGTVPQPPESDDRVRFEDSLVPYEYVDYRIHPIYNDGELLDVRNSKCCIYISRATSFPIDIGLRVNEGTPASPRVVVIAAYPEGDSSYGARTSPVRVAKDGKIYTLVVAKLDHPLASNVFIKLDDGSVKALMRLGEPDFRFAAPPTFQ